jgi:hypothetical protein
VPWNAKWAVLQRWVADRSLHLDAFHCLAASAGSPSTRGQKIYRPVALELLAALELPDDTPGYADLRAKLQAGE